MVGPAGSISDGAFSRAYISVEDELWLLEELPEACAEDEAGVNPANKLKIAAEHKAWNCNGRGVMRKPCLQV